MSRRNVGIALAIIGVSCSLIPLAGITLMTLGGSSTEPVTPQPNAATVAVERAVESTPSRTPTTLVVEIATSTPQPTSTPRIETQRVMTRPDRYWIDRFEYVDPVLGVVVCLTAEKNGYQTGVGIWCHPKAELTTTNQETIRRRSGQ